MPSRQKVDTRVFKRTPAWIPIGLQLSDKRRKIQTGAVLQTSFLGVRVQSNAALKQGEAVEIIRMTGTHGTVPARVVWVGKQRSERRGQVGLEFTDPLHARTAAH